MVRVFRRIAAVALFAAVAACAAESPAERAQNAELAQLAPLKAEYPGVITGFDISKETTLIVSVDVQGIIDRMEDADELGMKALVAHKWLEAWRAQHPHQHAKLTIRFVDYRGNKVFEGTTDG